MKQNIRQCSLNGRTSQERAQDLKERTRVAEERREDMLVSKRKMNIVWLHKWSLIKEKKEQLQRVCMNIKNVKNRKKAHIRAIKALDVLKRMFAVFDTQRKAVIRQQRIVFLAS